MLGYYWTKIQALFLSRRFAAAMFTAAFNYVGMELGWSEELLKNITGLGIAFILGDSLKDTTCPKLDNLRSKLRL